MEYQVKVQGAVVKSFSSPDGYNLGEVNNEVSSMIANGDVTVDESSPVLVEVVKVS